MVQGMLACSHMKRFTALVLGAAFLFAPLTTLAATSLASTHKESRLGWSIQPPKGWTKEQESENGYDMVTFWSPNGRAASLRVMVSEYSFGNTNEEALNEYTDFKKETLAKDLINYELESDEDVFVGSYPARLLTDTWNGEGTDKIRTETLIVAHNAKVYEIAATVWEDQWNLYEDAFDDSKDTFTFTKKESLKNMAWGEEKFRKFAVGTKLKKAPWTGTDNDFIDGGSGVDTAIYDGLRSQYTLYKGKEYVKDGYRKTVIVLYEETGDMDVLVNVELIRFADQTLKLPSFKVKK